jgi:hypothetical protein
LTTVNDFAEMQDTHRNEICGIPLIFVKARSVVAMKESDSSLQPSQRRRPIRRRSVRG